MKKPVEMMTVRPKSAGGKYHDGSPVLPTIHYQGSHRRTMDPRGAVVPRNSYYLRLLHSGDIEEIDKLPDIPPEKPKENTDPPKNLGFDNVITSAKER